MICLIIEKFKEYLLYFYKTLCVLHSPRFLPLQGRKISLRLGTSFFYSSLLSPWIIKPPTPVINHRYFSSRDRSVYRERVISSGASLLMASITEQPPSTDFLQQPIRKHNKQKTRKWRWEGVGKRGGGDSLLLISFGGSFPSNIAWEKNGNARYFPPTYLPIKFRRKKRSPLPRQSPRNRYLFRKR